MTTYCQFLDAHRIRSNRVGHLLSLIVAGCAIWYGVHNSIWQWSLMAVPLVSLGGGLSHAIFEGNRPAFFKHPLETPLLVAYDILMGIQTLLGIDEGMPTAPLPEPFVEETLDDQFNECWMAIGPPVMDFDDFEIARECFRRGAIAGSAETFARMRKPSMN